MTNPDPESLTVDDARALSIALGSQYAVLRMPGSGDFRWYSEDELAAVSTTHDGFVCVETATSFLTPETALALAAAIAEKAAAAFAQRLAD